MPNLRLRLSNRVESLAVVHAATGGLARALELDAVEADDLNTAVGEACRNVVWHAYEGTEGPLELELRTARAAVEALVRDHGIGIRPHVGERTLPHTGIGLPIVHSLTRSVLYTNLPDGGTEVRMRFDMPAAEGLEPCLEEDLTLAVSASEPPAPDALEMSLAPVSLAAFVLPGVLGALAQAAGLDEHVAAEAWARVATLAQGTARAPADAPLDVLVRAPAGELEIRVGEAPVVRLRADA